jgi:hypothetical protein
VSFWWKVSSESLDYLEFYINDVLAGRISGETDWQYAYFPLPVDTDCVLKWTYRKDESVTEGANCGWLDQVVFDTTDTRAASSTVVSGPGKATVYGQAVTFTATVAAAQGTGTPTGTVTFKDGSTILGTAPVSTGSATLSTSALAAGSHAITAVYNGDVAFVGSSSAAVSQVVNPAGSTTVLSSSAKSAVYGQALTFTAKISPVAPSTEPPSGTVTFKDGKAVVATAAVTGGQAVWTTTSLVVGSHTISAVFDGNANFQTSSSSAFRLTIGKAGSSTAVASSINPSVSGQDVTFAATVSAVAPSSGTPTGTVQFKVNGANYGSAVALSGGIANSAPVTTLSAGSTANVTAVYSGDTGYNGSTSATYVQTVQKADTTTTLLASTDASVFGQPVVLTAKVTAAGGGTPTGTVTFKDGATTLSTVTLTGGQCTYSSSALAVGAHSVTAVYGGNTGYNGSSTASSTTVNVQKAATTTTVTSSPRESVFGQSVTFTAAVNAVAPGAGTCSGAVQFLIDGVALGGPVNLSGAKATSSAISTLGLGDHRITAVYIGDSNFAGSDSSGSPLIQTVKRFAATIAVSASKNPAVVGDPLTWTATVSASSPDAGIPGGTVHFKIDGASFDEPVTLAGGTGTSKVMATLSAGSHTITAEYSGDADYVSATSAGLAQTVNPSPVTPATGGEAISAETAGGAWTTLVGPVYTESKVGSVGVGTVILNAPEGFEFDTTGTAPAVKIAGGSISSYNINDAANGSVLSLTTLSPSQLTFTVTAASSGKRNANMMTWQNIRVRPVAGASSASGILSKTGTAMMSGVTATTSFGYLAEIAGAATSLTQGLPANDNGAMNSTPASANIPVVIASLAKQADGSMELRASGVPGRTYFIQACETLGAWATISSQLADANGVIVFVDQDAPNYTSRFYRLAAE